MLLVLLNAGASVHAVDAGQTPLHRCLSWADLSEPSEIEPVIRLLVAAGPWRDGEKLIHTRES